MFVLTPKFVYMIFLLNYSLLLAYWLASTFYYNCILLNELIVYIIARFKVSQCFVVVKVDQSAKLAAKRLVKIRQLTVCYCIQFLMFEHNHVRLPTVIIQIIDSSATLHIYMTAH